MTKIILGADHAGFELKEKIKGLLKGLGMNFQDLGTNSQDRVDYPLYGKKVAQAVAKEQEAVGILVCGSGIGMCMAANKIKGIRAALSYDESTAKLAREHNNANVLCLGGRTSSAKNYKKIVQTFLETKFSAEPRHHKRVRELDAL
jgi:ribose 5-phosphate isomerase B